ncbi:MAG: type II toxin-antitoxin system VapC family toxin, partial [Campylobacteraceae bacterium]|nr:type II toxin-antitoxin system VapC family toxin [Campylobacteraceae bacterium]
GKYSSIAEYFRKIPYNEIKIPIIVKAELLFGIEKSERKENNRKAFENFIKPFEVINLNNDSLDYYAKIRAGLEKSGNIIGSNDLFIASIVLAHNGILITHNTNEFNRIEKLKIEDWVR